MSVTEESVRRLYDEHGSQSLVAEALGVSQATVSRRMSEAGAEPDRRQVSDEELLEDVARVAEEHAPTSTAYREHGRWTDSTVSRRFGGWSSALDRIAD